MLFQLSYWCILALITGFEPATLRLTAGRSSVELNEHIGGEKGIRTLGYSFEYLRLSKPPHSTSMRSPQMELAIRIERTTGCLRHICATNCATPAYSGAPGRTRTFDVSDVTGLRPAGFATFHTDAYYTQTKRES